MFYLRIAALSLFTCLLMASCTREKQPSHPVTSPSLMTDFQTQIANDKAAKKAQGDWTSTRVLEDNSNISDSYNSTFNFLNDGTFVTSTIDFEMVNRVTGEYKFTNAGTKLVMTYPESGRKITYDVEMLTRDVMTIKVEMLGKQMTYDFMKE